MFPKYLLFFIEKILYDEKGSVKGIATNDVGIGKDGKPTVSIFMKENLYLIFFPFRQILKEEWNYMQK